MSDSVQPNGTGGRTGARTSNGFSTGSLPFQSSNEQWGLADTKGATYQPAFGSKDGQNRSGAVGNVRGGNPNSSSNLGGVQPNGNGGRTGSRSGGIKFGRM